MSGWFELNRNGESQYHFVLKASDGDPILSSKTYQSKVSAQRGIGSVQTHSQSHDRYEKRASQKNQSYFVLKDTDSQIIGLSQLHSSTAARDADMASVKTYGNGHSCRCSFYDINKQRSPEENAARHGRLAPIGICSIGA